MSLVIYHNPSCGTSRKVLGLIRAAGIEPEIVRYLDTSLSKKALTDLLGRLKLRPRDILRRRGTPYDDLGLGDKALPDSALIDAMVANPILIERPIVVGETGALLCRPPERVLELLPATTKPDSTNRIGTEVVEKPTRKGPARKTHVFRASLDKKHYRDFEIPGNDKLDSLAEAIVTAFGFNFDHAYGFYSDLGDHVYHSEVKYELFADMGDADADSRSVKKTKIAEAFPTLATKMTFLFDYGDEWLFLIEMIGEGLQEPKQKYPKLIKSVGKAPEQYPEEGE